MTITRVFLGWKQPGLVSAVDWLVERFGQPGILDLSGAMVVMPGGRAGRRLLEILVQRAERESMSLFPPRIETIGRLPELLYPAKRPFADTLTQQLAWIEAVRRCDPSRLKRLVPSPPAEHDLPSWLALAEMLAGLHRELAAEGLNFGDVASKGPSLPEFREALRWHTLEEIQAVYLRTLDKLGLWDVQTARLVAIKLNECRTDHDVVLIGMADMNRAMRQFLDLIAPRVTALVLAPPELADRFDPHGCICVEAWQEAKVDLDDEQIELVDDPADQAASVVRAIADFDGQFCGEEITVGVPDAEVVPYLEQYLRQAGVSVRSGVGTTVARTSPCRLLADVADYVEHRRFASLAALVRHPAVQNWLEGKLPGETWLSRFDEYYGEHLPAGLDDLWIGSADDCRTLKNVYRKIEDLLKPLGGDKQPLGSWAQAIVDLLTTVFGDKPLNTDIERDRSVLDACYKIQAVVARHRSVPQQLAPAVTGATAVRLVLRELEGEVLGAPQERGAVELLGWLELPLDDAPAMVVTGFNEGIVPGSRNADLFLPNQLRLALGLEDNDRRYARDAYALSLLAHSRQRLKLIAGRRTAEGDPLTPSRLLFACDSDKLPRRSLRLFAASDAVRAPAILPGSLRPGGDGSAFEPRRPAKLAEPVTRMRVTEFRDYIACPYRYYLRHRLGLRSLSDAADELDWGGFGSLAHSVLRDFGRSSVAASRDPEVVFAHLSDLLDQQVAACYGRSPLPSIRVQAEQLRSRLKAFAVWQAAWAADGWRIEHVEVAPKDKAAYIEVDGTPMYLRGRIDRIDVHEQSGIWRVFDYKSSDRRHSPDEKHRVKGEWVDLQLPLYRHLAATLGGKGKVELGYIVLPKNVADTGCVLAEWSDEELAGADQKAAEIIRAVRAEKFWPPTSPPPDFCEEFSAICLDNRYGFLNVEDEEGVSQ